VGESDTFVGVQTRTPVARPEAIRAVPDPRDVARPAFRAWPEIQSRLRAAERWAFFLDFDGTLVNLRNRPGDVRMPAQAGRILQRLVTHTNVFVAIVSGRSLKDLRRLVNVNGLHYFGLHGAERDGKLATLSSKARAALQSAKRAARLHLGVIRGIWIEDKGLSFSVHHRDADAPAFARADAALADLVATWGDALHILNGSRVWEVLPREIPGKFAAVEEVLRKLPADIAVVYIGDDGTDEMAFAVLPNQITVRVGREPTTCARYYVRTPADVLRLLARMEKELT
jgi:trehalose 6-phosphate phosphatase